MIDLIHGDCLVEMAKIPDKSVDLIVTDPPYQIDNTKPGGNSKLARSIQHMNNQLQESNLCSSFNLQVLDEMVRVQRNINCYIWCNAKQIPMYLSYFVDRMGCNFDILIWQKSNAVPLFYNKYLTDKEYCLYFRRGGVLQS
ncbi:MAG: site-specific DNA-methyltransferase [Lachnospiraceae bacterium]|nr:site-specific DNA-methyltransferase [Lachnospiraceae bacterium]